MSSGVLVIESEEDIFRVTRELIGGLCPVVSATDADTALQIMQTREIAVVIADVEPGKEQLVAMLKLLKQEHPQILTIITIKMADSELVIDLINQAQVFRILNKPINVSLLKSHLHAALQRYLTYQQAPNLLHEHKVASFELSREDSAGRGIFDRIKSLRGRWLGS
jgi:serine/threonine-protein kinase